MKAQRGFRNKLRGELLWIMREAAWRVFSESRCAVLVCAMRIGWEANSSSGPQVDKKTALQNTQTIGNLCSEFTAAADYSMAET